MDEKSYNAKRLIVWPLINEEALLGHPQLDGPIALQSRRRHDASPATLPNI
jgi:hypothetical protein